MLKLKSVLFVALCALICLCRVGASAQTTLTAGLKAPTKLLLTDGGHLLVAETGTGHNDGRVSLIDRCGNRLTVIDGLPSGPSADGAPSGPTGLALRGTTLFIAIGGGDATVRGPRQGTEVENPNGPSSPIFSAVLAVDLGVDADELSDGVALSVADHAALKAGARLALPRANGQTISVRLLIDFADFVADPFTIARPSNPFALAVSGDALFIADASYNRVSRVDAATGAILGATDLAFIANPLPIGGPRIEPVPDGLALFGDQLLVTLLTGFPFAAGKSEVRAVPLSGGDATTFMAGLNSTIDLVAARTRNGADQFFALEYSANFLQNAPGRVLRFDGQTSAPTVVAEGLRGPVGLARDSLSGDLFVSEIFTGRIVRFEGSEFSAFLRDAVSGNLLRINTQTGEYLFTSCATGATLSGRARVNAVGCQLELRDARVAAILDRCDTDGNPRGAAVIRLSPLGPTLTINDNDPRSLAKLLAPRGGDGLPECPKLGDIRAVRGRIGSYCDSLRLDEK